LLIVGSAFAGGIFVFQRQSVENADSAQSQVQVAPESQATSAASYRGRPLSPAFVPEGNATNSFAIANSQQTDGATTSNALSAGSERTTNIPGGATSIAPEQSAGGALLRPQPPPKIATTALAESLVRKALRSPRSGQSAGAIEIETLEADDAVLALCAPSETRQFDMIVTSRRVTSFELGRCQDNAGHNIVESKLGYQALVLTSARGSASMKLTPSDVFLAIAKLIPDPAQPELFIPNPNVTWDQINRLEYRPIMIFGPARETPRRTAFEILLLKPGCNAHRAIQGLRTSNPERHADLCHSLRTDRTYVEVEQNALLIPQYLWSDPNPLVLVDYAFYRENREQLTGSAIEGPEPSYESIADGSYSLSRPIFLYLDRTRLARSRGVYVAMDDLANMSFYTSDGLSFVPLNYEDAREQRLQRMRKLSGSNLPSK
jgi:phosphate transport system substrate-binding protein